MNIPKQSLSGPFARFDTVPELQRMTWRDAEHTPSNKVPGTADSLCEIQFDRHDTGGWFSIDVLEMTTHPGGRVTSRSIHTTISLETAKRLGKFILTGE